MPNPDGMLKPGMFLNVRIARDERDAMIIPEAALVPEQSRQFVFVVEDGHAVRREIQIGTREPGRVEVVRGLQAGEHVVVEGTQKMRDGFAIHELKKPAPARASPTLSHLSGGLEAGPSSTPSGADLTLARLTCGLMPRTSAQPFNRLTCI